MSNVRQNISTVVFNETHRADDFARLIDHGDGVTQRVSGVSQGHG